VGSSAILREDRCTPVRWASSHLSAARSSRRPVPQPRSSTSRGSPNPQWTEVRLGRFDSSTDYTSLEDRNQTVVIDIASHAPIVVWEVPRGQDGPRGVAVDADERGLVFVACTDRVLVLDGLHNGAPLGAVESGAGLTTSSGSRRGTCSTLRRARQRRSPLAASTTSDT
jgi:hypothetical protein